MNRLFFSAMLIFYGVNICAFNASISPGVSVLSSDYFDNGRTLAIGTQFGKKFAGFYPFSEFSFIQARGEKRDDLSLTILLLKGGLRRHLFNLTPRNDISFAFATGVSLTKISTENSSETSYIPWIFPALGLTFELNQSVGIIGDFSYGISLEKSRSSLIMLGLGLKVGS
ncbi:hypothetical protein JXA84_00670 [candidate division WOR-3 bacterium]|nr:hypothetical protein [candidate division WOR-3 bacterium]